MKSIYFILMIPFILFQQLQGVAEIQCTCVNRTEIPGVGGNWVNNWYELSVPECASREGILQSKNMLNKVSFTKHIRFDESGLLTQLSGDPFVNIVNGGFTEKFYLSILSTDGHTILAEHTLVPFPFVLTYEGNRTIEIAASDPAGLFVVVKGSGFKPNETLKFKSWSSCEILSSTKLVDNNGNFRMLYSAAVTGKTEGPYELTFTDEAQNTYKVRQIWGRNAFQNPLIYEKLIQSYQFPLEPY